MIAMLLIDSKQGRLELTVVPWQAYVLAAAFTVTGEWLLFHFTHWLHYGFAGFIAGVAFTAAVAAFAFYLASLAYTDRITAKPDVIRVKLGGSHGPGFYPMRWSLPLDGESRRGTRVEVAAESGRFALRAPGVGGVFVSIYETDRESLSLRIAENLNEYYREISGDKSG